MMKEEVETRESILEKLNDTISRYRKKLEDALSMRELILNATCVPTEIEVNLPDGKIEITADNTADDTNRDQLQGVLIPDSSLANLGDYELIVVPADGQVEAKVMKVEVESDNEPKSSDLPNEYLCNFCGVTILGKKPLAVHINKHLRQSFSRRKIYRCGQCRKVFTRVREFQCHKVEHDGLMPYKCEVCGVKYLLMTDLKRHKRRNHNIKEGRTSGPRSEVTFPDLIPRKRFPCPLCNKQLTSAARMREHMKTHEDNRFQCKVCLKFFKTRRKRALHTKEHKDAEELTCEVCSAVFHYEDDLKVHVNHHKRPTYICPYCAKIFNNLTICNNHLRRHTGEKPYVCETCGKNFISQAALTTHLRNHEMAKANLLTCDICNKTFKNKLSMENHMRIHADDLRTACPTCGKAFPGKHPLQQHMRIHTGERPFACHMCEKAYTVKLGLERHLLRHLGEGPFACDICSSRFYSNHDLKRHMMKHSNLKMYRCELCDKSYSFRTSYVKHMMGKHQQSKEEQVVLEDDNVQCIYEFCDNVTNSKREGLEHLMQVHNLKIDIIGLQEDEQVFDVIQ